MKMMTHEILLLKQSVVCYLEFIFDYFAIDSSWGWKRKGAANCRLSGALNGESIKKKVNQMIEIWH